MPVALSSQQFESTYPVNQCTIVCIAIQPVDGQHWDRVRWNPPVEGNRMAQLSKRPHGYRDQQDEERRYLTGQMSVTVGKGLIGVRSARGIYKYRSRSVRMAIEVGRKKMADTSPRTGRCPLASGRPSSQSSRVRKGLIGTRAHRGNQ